MITSKDGFLDVDRDVVAKAKRVKVPIYMRAMILARLYYIYLCDPRAILLNRLDDIRNMLSFKQSVIDSRETMIRRACDSSFQYSAVPLSPSFRDMLEGYPAVTGHVKSSRPSRT